MPQIFPKWANQVPRILLISAFLGLTGVVLFFWYFGSNKYLEVGYAPVQPVAYSHLTHAGKLGIDCRYCHTSVETASAATIPPTQTCMNCHSQIWPDTSSVKGKMLEPVRQSWTTGNPIEWVRVHNLPDYAHFNHAAHVNVGVSCVSCHGRVDRMEVVTQSEPLSMGWCLDCHRNPAPNLRPKAEVTNLAWTPGPEQPAFAAEQIKKLNINPPVNCNGCHY
jgi:hypothetical protein